MEWLFGLIRVQSSVVVAWDGIWGLAALTVLSPALSPLLFVLICTEFAVPCCQSAGQGSAAAGCMKYIFKPEKLSNRGRLHLGTR